MLDELTPQHVQHLIRRKTDEELAPRTIRYMRGVLRAALSDAGRWGLVGRNAAALAEVPRAEHQQVQTLDPKQARTLLTAAKKNPIGSFFSVALHVGLRLGEGLALGWEGKQLV